MESNEPGSIIGVYRLKFLDQMYWTFSAPAKIFWTLSAGTTLFSTFVVIHDYLSYGISIATLFTIATFVALLTPLVAVLVVSINAIYFLRLSLDQKNLRWEINQMRLSLTDGAGNSIQFPWRQIKYVAGRRTGVLVALKPVGHRWIAQRAFSDDDWVLVFEWAKASGIHIRLPRRRSYNPRS